MTEDQKQKHVLAAIDSVNLINSINSMQNPTQINIDDKNRNIGHLNIMISKEWFIDLLSTEQFDLINDVIL